MRREKHTRNNGEGAIKKRKRKERERKERDREKETREKEEDLFT